VEPKRSLNTLNKKIYEYGFFRLERRKCRIAKDKE
jgi:hypothetical protein